MILSIRFFSELRAVEYWQGCFPLLWPDGQGPLHHGVCSTWLNTIALNETVPCFIRRWVHDRKRTAIQTKQTAWVLVRLLQWFLSFANEMEGNEVGMSEFEKRGSSLSPRAIFYHVLWVELNHKKILEEFHSRATILAVSLSPIGRGKLRKHAAAVSAFSPILFSHG